MRSVIVVGGGVIGLSIALQLRERGFEVMLLDREAAPTGASIVNAGMIVPSHFVPLAAPGALAAGLRWMVVPGSPFSIHPPRTVGDLRWLGAFARHSNRRNVDRSMHPLLELHLRSRAIYCEWAERYDLAFHTTGILMAYRSERGRRHELETAELARSLGLRPELLTAAGVGRLDPKADYHVSGGVWYPLDGHLDPRELVGLLRRTSEGLGVELRYGCGVEGLDLQDEGRVRSVRTPLGRFDADEYVVAAGVWSQRLIRALGAYLPLISGKGYSVDLRNSGLTIPALLSEARVAVSPMGATLRVAGTMEVGAPRTDVRPAKLRGILRSLAEYLTLADTSYEPPVGVGLRPLSPDGRPYIGRLAGFENLTVAAGHAMMGVSLAAATGAVVAELLESGETSTDLTPFSPNRYAR